MPMMVSLQVLVLFFHLFALSLKACKKCRIIDDAPYGFACF
jgi:hypothetical protein